MLPLPRLLLPLLLSPALLVTGCGGNDGGSSSKAGDTSGPHCTYTSDGSSAGKDVSPPPATATVSGTVHATMTTSVGKLGLSLDAASAPCTVGSFVSLAKQGYFDGTSCHRLTTPDSGISVLQCGDPSGTGSGGPGYTFPDELTGKETYPAGTLAMANAGPDTNGSQFFIVYGDTPLEAKYTVFGTIDAAGLQAVKTVAKAGTDNAQGPGDGHPKTPVKIDSVSIG